MLPLAKRIFRGIVKVVAMVCRLRIITPTAKLVSNLHREAINLDQTNGIAVDNMFVVGP
jgi:hypothetical protein